MENCRRRRFNEIMRRWPTKAAKNKEALRFFKYPKTFPYYIAAFELRALLRTCRDAAHHSRAAAAAERPGAAAAASVLSARDQGEQETRQTGSG